MPSQTQTSSPSNAAVLKHDWDLLPDTADLFFHRSHPYDKEKPAVDAEGALLLLTRRWQASWKTERPSTVTPPHPEELVDVARHMFGPMRDLNRSGPSHVKLLDKASLALVRGLWEADPEQLRLAYLTVKEIGGNAHRQIYAVGAKTEPVVDRLPDSLLSGTDYGVTVDPDGFNFTEEAGRWGGAKVTRLTLFFLEALGAVNQRIRDLASSGRMTADAAGPGARGQLSHLIEEVLRSALTGHTLKVNADIVDALTRSPDPRDQARLAAFWKVYPDVQRAADQALLAPPAILSMRQGVMGRSDRLDVPAIRHEPAALDERQPWATFAERSPETIQTLDRARGTLTIALTDDRAPYTKTITFEPWRPEDGDAARLRQDQTLRWIEAFSVTHFSGTWNLPDHLVMEDGRFKAGSLTLAEHAPAGWRLNRPAIREAATHFGAVWIAHDRTPLSAWSGPTKSLGLTRTTGILDELRIVLQVEGDSASQQGSTTLTEIAPVYTMWIQQAANGESRVLHGASLAALVGPTTAIKLIINGHGGRVWNGGGAITLGFHVPEKMAQLATDALRAQGIHRPVDQVVLLSCALESSASDASFAEPFLRSAFDAGLVTPAATVTAYRHLMYITGSEGRTAAPYAGAERRHRVPDVTRVFQRDPDTGAISVRDKYPALQGDALWVPPLHRRAPFRHVPLIKVAPKDRQVLAAMPNPGLFDLVAQELQRHLPRFEAAPGVDTAPVDAAIASLWNLLADDAQVSAQASPEAARQSAISRIEAEFGRQSAAEATRLVREAGESLIAGLREVDPRKLYEAYLKTAAAYQITRGSKPERLTLQDVASGWFATESDLELRHWPELQTVRVVQRDGMAFLIAMSDAMRTLASSELGKDGARMASARVMEQVVRAMLLREPFLIDADAVAHMAASSASSDQSRLNALRATYLMQQRLARRGLLDAPRFVSMLARDVGEWRELPGGPLRVSDSDLLNALSGPLPPPLPLKDMDAAIDPEAPLRGLTGGKRGLVQTLDRERGRIDIELSLDIGSATSSDGRSFKSSVFFDPLPAGATPEQRLRQDRQIRQLDDFLRAHFNRIIDRPEHGLPPEIRLAGHEILVGQLRVATEKDGRWVGDPDAISRAVGTLWVHDRVIPSFDGTRQRLDFSLPSFRRPAKRLTLVLQMENDADLTLNARRLTQKRPEETAWVQLGRDGGIKIVVGEELVRGLAWRGDVKLVVVGHGTRRGSLDEAELSGYSAQALASRLDKALGELRLPRRVDQTTLFGCVLESPVFPRSFASEFLLAADKLGFLRPAATVTAYAEEVAVAITGERRTRPDGDAAFQHRRPEATFTFHIDAGTETVVRSDKHPAVVDEGIVATAQRGDTGVRLGLAFSDDADPTRQPGQAGKLFELFTTLKRTLKQASTDAGSEVDLAVVGETPEAITTAVRHRLEAQGGGRPQAVADLLPGAAKLIADGLWQRNPDLLYDGFVALSRAFGEYAPEHRYWRVGDRPMGVVDQVRMPSQLLSQFPADLELPVGEFVFMEGLDAGVASLRGLSTGTAGSAGSTGAPLRLELGRQTAALLQAALSGRPFTVDLDLVQTLSTSDAIDDGVRLRTLEIVHGAAMKLADNGVMPAPIYLTDFPQGRNSGWEDHPDGSRIHRGDLLPALLPDRQSAIDRLRTPTPTDVDDARPLARLAAFMPLATQTLDRDAGTITIDWPAMAKGRQAPSVLKFRAAAEADGTDGRRLQDIDIQTLDAFLAGTFLPYDGLPANTVPAELRLEGDQLIAGRALLAERKEGRWIAKRETILEVQHALKPQGSLDPFPAVDQWDFIPDSDFNRADADGTSGRLLLVLQMEPGEEGVTYAARSIVGNPDDAVWIQVDSQGGHRIRSGAHLLERATAQTPIKMEVVGHGRHDLKTRTQTLAGYSSAALVERLASLKVELSLKAEVGRATLISCRLETPAVLGSFGSEFLEQGIRKGLMSGDATVVSYGQVLVTPEMGDDWVSRSTEQYPGAPYAVHEPGVTWIHHREAGSDRIIRTDKHPATDGGPSTTVLGAGDGAVQTSDPLRFSTRDARGIGTRQAGQAGTLMETFKTLERLLGRSQIGPLAGDPPRSIIQAIQDELLRMPAPEGTTVVERAPRAARQIAEGLWRLDPMALYAGFAEMSRLHGRDAALPFHWNDRPSGMVSRVSFPSRMLEAFRQSALLPAAEVGLLRSLDVGLKAMAAQSDHSTDDMVRVVLGHQTSMLVRAVLSGRPYTVDVDRLRLVAPTGRKRKPDTTEIDVLEVVHGAARHLARHAGTAAPIYMTDAEVGPQDGWEAHPDGSRVHRGDLLPGLLPGREDRIARMREPFTRDIDEANPLAALARFMPEAKQVLDRARGTLTIIWPAHGGRRQADSVLRFRAAKDAADVKRRGRQDADIRALDAFIVPAFFDSADSPLNGMPSELTLKEDVLTAGRAQLARRADGRWIRDTEALLEHRSVLEQQFDIGGPTSVQTWQAGLGGALRGKEGQGDVIGDKLRLYVQIQDDDAMLKNARRAIRNHPDEVVWIQIDRLGHHRIRYGEHLLKQAGPALPVKISFIGHGHHDPATRSQRFGGLTPLALADLAAPVIERLGLSSRADQAMLLGCALVPPSIEGDYAAEFMKAAIDRKMFREDVELTAYAQAVITEGGLDDDISPRKQTRRYPGAGDRRNEPGVTWVYTRDAGTERIVRTDKYAAGDGDSYGLDDVRAVHRYDVGDLRPGRAGGIFELFSVLSATQTQGGLATLAGAAPRAVVEAVQGSLRSLLAKLDGTAEHDLSVAANAIADGLWQRDPVKLQAGYVKLSDICGADGQHVSEVTWNDRPAGVVEQARLPSELLWKFTRSMKMPLPDAALLAGMQRAMTAMDGLPPQAQPDPLSRAFARQTPALLEVLLSGRPFVVDADAMFRMSTSGAVDDRSALAVLEVVHGTVMRLADMNLLKAPIYLSESGSPDAGWEARADGSLVHRGDLLPSLLPERRSTIESLRMPADLAFDEANPLPRLGRLMPQATQTLDRQAGTLRIGWPDMKDGRQADSVLTFRPSEAGSGTQGRRLQDADILAIDQFIAAEFVESANRVRNSVPGALTLREGRLTAGRSVVAERREGRWWRDDAAMRELQSILRPQDPPMTTSKPASAWIADLEDVLTGVDVKDSGARLLIHLQMENDPALFRGARRLIRSHPDETVWIQVDRQGGHVIRYGEDFLKRAGPDLPVKIEISGHGSHDHATRTQQLAGYSATELADRVKSVIDGLGLTSRAANLTLVSCAIETPPVSDSFGTAFTQAAIDQGVLRKDATVVAYGETLIRNQGLEGKQPSRTTRRHPGATPTARAPGVTWMFRKGPGESGIERIDKYPAGSKAASEGVTEAATHDEDAAWNRLEEHRSDPRATRHESVVDGLAGRTLHVDGIDVPMAFLATLGAQIDGEPLTGDLLRSIADLPGNPLARLAIDPELFEQWVTLLTDRPDDEVADRLRALGTWLEARETPSGAGSAFIDEPSSTVREIVERLTTAAARDADGISSSDAELLKAARGDDAAPTSLLGDILRDLSTDTRADFEDWLARTGQRLDDVAGMAPPRGSHGADTPVEKVAREIGRRAVNDDGIDLHRMQGLNRSNSLASLQEIGVVTADSRGLRLDAGRLQSFMDSQDLVKVAYAGRAVRKLSGQAYRTLFDSAPDRVRSFMTAQRQLPSASRQAVAAFSDRLDGAVDFVDTLQGIYQILTNWREMSPAVKGLSVTQSLSVLVSPLAMMAGRALSTLAPVARSGVLRAVSAGLAGGAANVAFAVVGVASNVLQWQDFNASGQSLDSHAGKSLIANTVMTAVSTAVALASATIGTMTVLAGGAAAIAGTALGVASSIMGAAAAPVAVLMFVTNAVVQAALWFDEFGQYIRESTSVGDRVLAAFAKAFGFSTDVTMRAEVEKSAREAAVRLSNAMKGDFTDAMEFEAGQLAKQGYDRFLMPDTKHPVQHVVFADRESSGKYNYALQPKPVIAGKFRELVKKRAREDLPPGTALLSMDKMVGKTHFHRFGDDAHLFQGGNLVDATVIGGPGIDRFHVKKTDGVTLFGPSGKHEKSNPEDEVQIDAEGSDVTIKPDLVASDGPLLIQYAGLSDTKIHQIHRIVVRNAAKATVVGSREDERFDISAKEGLIGGLEGRNTYLLRDGNQITSTSNDVAIWTRGVKGATVDVGGGGTSASLLLKVHVLHEALSLRRDGQDLVVIVDKESLTLKRYFDRLNPSSRASAPVVTLVDAVGSVITLINPEVIGKKGVPLTELEKHVVFSTALPASRRTLSGDKAYSRFHLSSGAGDLRVLPMTGLPMDLSLDIPTERLTQLAEGDDLIIVETPPADAKTDFAPLRLRLSGQRRTDRPANPGDVTVWAKDKDRAPIALILPAPGKAVGGPIAVSAPLKVDRVEAKGTSPVPGSETPAPAPAPTTPAPTTTPTTPGRGTDKGDTIDARELPDGTVLCGGSGADTYRIKAGQSLVIDNSAQDAAQDVLEIVGIGAGELMEGIRFSRSGGDLVIRIAEGTVTVRNHATLRHARRLSLEVAGVRYTLPVIQDGFMVHRPAGAETDVLATAPGAHLVLLDPAAPWDLSAAPRTVWTDPSVEWRRDGSSEEGRSTGNRPATVLLMDYHLNPAGWQLSTPGVNQASDRHRDASEMDAVSRGVRDVAAAVRSVGSVSHRQVDVKAYLTARGMPERIAAEIRSDTTDQLRRIHALLTIAVEEGAWKLPAAFIDAYAASDLKPSPGQGRLLRHLASRGSPWSYDERVLRRGLSMTQLQAFESWASVRFQKTWGDDAPAALDDFIRLLDGKKPSTPFAVPLLAKVLELKGRPAAVAQDLALAMLAAGTLDDQWAAGMLQAGVVHHDTLSRLWAAGVSPQDVALGNANRLHYEGSGDRSALIDVDTSNEFKAPSSTVYRYTLTHYLKLNAAGTDFARTDKKPQPGIEYDLVPGVIVDQNGESPEPDSTYKKWKLMFDEKTKEEERRLEEIKTQNEGSKHTRGRGSGISFKALTSSQTVIPPLSSVVRLKRDKLAVVESYQVGGTWDGRSAPGNLVDGLEGHDEVVAWRPGVANPSPNDNKSITKISVDAGKFIQFDFAHPIALGSLTLRFSSRKSSVIWSKAFDSLSKWVVDAKRAEGQWTRVSPQLTLHDLEHGKQERRVMVDTQGVPYRHYRLTGVDGMFPVLAWLGEVTFTTAEAGGSPPDAADALRSAGFSDDEVRSLFLLGLRDTAQAKRASDLRRHFGTLPLAVVIDDVQGHDSLNQEEIAILADLKARSVDQPRWSPETLLDMVRQRAVSQHIERLNAQLPFFDPATVEDDEHRQMVAQIKQALFAKPDHGGRYAQRYPSLLPPRWPAGLENVVKLSSMQGHGFERYWQAPIDHEPYGPAQSLLYNLHRQLAGRHGEAGALRITAPWFLHLTALAAAAYDRTLHLALRPVTSQADAVIESVIKNSLGRLQSARDGGLLHVAFMSAMAPVGEASPWTAPTPGGDAVHVSPGLDLAAEFRAAQAGQPVPRLIAGGFTEADAKALFDGGVHSLDQVTRAIEWRQLFKGLSWETIADDVLYQPPFDEEQIELANYLRSLRGWEGRPETSSTAVRQGLSPAQRAQLVDGLLPSGNHALIQRGMVLPHVKSVRGWLHDAQDPDGQGPEAPAFTSIALRLLQAAGGMDNALQSAIDLAVKVKLSYRGRAAEVASSPWPLRALDGLVSLAPADGGAKALTLDAPLHIVLVAYERLLDELAFKLGKTSASPEDVAEALRPRYLDLAVLRAAAGGQQLRLHVPPGESPQELAFKAMIEARLPALQKAEAFKLLDVTIASSMPPAGALEPWTTEVVDGKTWHLSPDVPLEAGWREGNAGQAIPVLTAGGFSAEEARQLYELNVRTDERVTRAIQMRQNFGALSPEVVAKEVETPFDHIEDAWFWRQFRSLVSPDPAELLAAVRANKVKPLPELKLEIEHLSGPWNSALWGIQYPSYSPLRVLLKESLSHLEPEAVDDAAARIFSQLLPATRGRRGALGRAILHLEWLHIRRGLQSTVTKSSPWMPEVLRHVASIGPGEGPVAGISTSTAIVLQTFERFLETLNAELMRQGHDKASAMDAVRPLFLRMAALRAAASGQQLRLHVPATGSPEDRREVRILIQDELEDLQLARQAGLIDVAIASPIPPVDRADDWTSHVMDGGTLHVSSKAPLEVAWRDGLLSRPFDRMTAAGYTEEDAQALHDGGIKDSEQVERAIQLRGFFGDSSPEVILQDVLVNPPFSHWQIGLARRLRWLADELGVLETLKLVRTDPTNDDARAFLVSGSLPLGSRGLFYFADEDERRAYEANIREWLADTQGPAWSANEALLASFVSAMCHAAIGGVASLPKAFGIARGLGLLYRGQETVVDQSDWMIERVGRHATLRPTDGGNEWPAMAASDYIVLKGFKRLLDAVRSDRAGFAGESRAAELMSRSYLALQVLRAAATGQRIEVRQAAGAYDQVDDLLARAIEDFREPLEAFRSAGLLKVSFLPAVPAEETQKVSSSEVPLSGGPDMPAEGGVADRAMEDEGPGEAHGGDAARQANLFKQAMSSQQESDFGGTSSFGLPRMPSPQALLTAPAG